MLKLIIEDDEGRKTVVPFVRDEITIGRQEGNTIRLTERNVSRRHARLMRQNAHVLIEDLGSYNGIRVNGDRITGQVPLNDGDLVQIGDYDLAIQREEGDLKASAALTVPLEGTAPRAAVTAKDSTQTIPLLPVVEPPPEAADEDVQDASPEERGEPPRNQSTAVIRVDQVATNRAREVTELDATEAPRLVVLNTDFAGKEFTCSRTEMRIGRTDDNDIALDHRSLSRTHCKVVRENSGEWRVIDMQSANGLMVNGEPYAQVSLRSGDVLELGHLKMKFLAAGERFTVAASSSSVTAEAEAEGSGSKAPLIAIISTVVVLVVFGGGYALWKSGPAPVKPPRVPLAAGGGVASGAAGGTAAVHVEPPKVDNTVAQREAAEKTITDAKAAIEALDWNKAEVLLRECKIAESACPAATALLVTMQGEKSYRIALDSAEAALAKGDLETANVQLEASRGTTLLTNRLIALQATYSAKLKDKLNTQPPVVVVKNPPPPQIPANTLEAQKLFDAAQKDIKDKAYPAAKNKLEACTRTDPKFASCYRVLGTTYAHLNDYPNVLKNYRQYLAIAPADDPMVPKVQKSVKDIEERLELNK